MMYTKEERDKIIHLGEKYLDVLKSQDKIRMSEIESEFISILMKNSNETSDNIKRLRIKMDILVKDFKKAAPEFAESKDTANNFMERFVEISKDLRQYMKELMELSKKNKELRPIMELLYEMGDQNKKRVAELEKILSKLKKE